MTHNIADLPADQLGVEVIKILPDPEQGDFLAQLWWKADDDDNLFAPDGSGRGGMIEEALNAAFANLKEEEG